MDESIFAFQSRYEDHFTRKLALKERELDRAKRVVRMLSLTLTEERKRAAAALEKLEAICEDFRGKEPSQARYIAILAFLRAKRAFSGERE